MKKVGHQGWCGPATGTQAFFKLLYLFRCRPFCISTHFSCLPDHRQRSASQVSDGGYLFANGGDHLFQFSCLFEKGVNKIMPELLRGFITPALTLAVFVPLTLLVFGPI